MPFMFRLAAAIAVLPLLAFTQSKPATTVTSAAGSIRVETLAAAEYPWGIAELPDGRVLITEKPGRLRIYENGTLSAPLQGIPKTSYRERKQEQGGLLDVAVDPNFAQNRRIYFSFSEPAATQSPDQKETDDKRFGGFLDLTDNMLVGGAVARATLDGSSLKDVEVIWRQNPKMIGRGHFGHRIAFGKDGTMFITSGDRMRFDPAQDPDSSVGKVVRINADGSVPKDNPTAGKDVWSIGHRNMLSALVHPGTGQLYVVEMGPLGGDELNVIQKGGNYGWPVVSNGDNYDKSVIPDHGTRKDFIAPIKTWTPVISPSGGQFYQGSLFPWKGDMLVGGLSSMAIIRLTIDGNTVKHEERIDMKRRIRDILQARDGALLVITDEKDGALLRLTPEGGKTR